MNIKELNLFYINGDSKTIIIKSYNKNIDFFFFVQTNYFKSKAVV